MPTRLRDVHAALVSVFTAAFAADDTVGVYNGAALSGNTERTQILVGLADDEGQIGRATQALSAVGNNWRDEEGAIFCAVESWAGNGIAELREIAEAALNVCEAAVRAGRTLGGVLTAPGLAEVTEVGWGERQTENGPVVRWSFTVSYGALLTT